MSVDARQFDLVIEALKKSNETLLALLRRYIRSHYAGNATYCDCIICLDAAALLTKPNVNSAKVVDKDYGH